MSEIVREAFMLLYPNRNISSYKFSLTYSGRFKDFGANVKYCMNKVDFFLSNKWQGVNNNIVIGLLHELFIKIFKTKTPHTMFYVDLYNAYVKNMHIAAPKTKIDSFLLESFNRVNEKYFMHDVEQPNLVWGRATRRKLGCYDYCTDTITISSIFRNKEPIFTDYVMHHEMLHKHLKFDDTKKKSRFHTTEFRKLEKRFERSEEIEKAISNGFKFKTSNFLDLFKKRVN